MTCFIACTTDQCLFFFYVWSQFAVPSTVEYAMMAAVQAILVVSMSAVHGAFRTTKAAAIQERHHAKSLLLHLLFQHPLGM
jgi:hypothetical protein